MRHDDELTFLDDLIAIAELHPPAALVHDLVDGREVLVESCNLEDEGRDLVRHVLASAGSCRLNVQWTSAIDALVARAAREEDQKLCVRPSPYTCLVPVVANRFEAKSA